MADVAISRYDVWQNYVGRGIPDAPMIFQGKI